MVKNSFKGWNFKEWFKGNWSTVKEVIKLGIPCLIGWFATGDKELTALITLVGKLVIDAGHYYIKK